MYTPPAGTRRTSFGITHCSEISLETKFSERKVPHGSEYSFISRQKVLSARRAGTRVGPRAGTLCAHALGVPALVATSTATNNACRARQANRVMVALLPRRRGSSRGVGEARRDVHAAIAQFAARPDRIAARPELAKSGNALALHRVCSRANAH